MFSVLRAKKLFSKKSERDAADGTSAAGAHAPAHKSRSNLLQTRHFTFTNHLTPCPLCFLSSRAFRSSSPPYRCRFGCCLGLRSDCTHTPCKQLLNQPPKPSRCSIISVWLAVVEPSVSRAHTRSIRPSLIGFGIISIHWHCSSIHWHRTSIYSLFFQSVKTQGHHELQSFSCSRIESRCRARVKPHVSSAHPARLGRCNRGCFPRQGTVGHQERG